MKAFRHTWALLKACWHGFWRVKYPRSTPAKPSSRVGPPSPRSQPGKSACTFALTKAAQGASEGACRFHRPATAERGYRQKRVHSLIRPSPAVPLTRAAAGRTPASRIMNRLLQNGLIGLYGAVKATGVLDTSLGRRIFEASYLIYKDRTRGWPGRVPSSLGAAGDVRRRRRGQRRFLHEAVRLVGHDGGKVIALEPEAVNFARLRKRSGKSVWPKSWRPSRPRSPTRR